MLRFVRKRPIRRKKKRLRALCNFIPRSPSEKNVQIITPA
jgi:hypothetical protein